MLLAQNATCVNTKDATDGNSFAKYSILSNYSFTHNNAVGVNNNYSCWKWMK